MNMIVDSHCHLAMNDFSSDLSEVIKYAQQRNVNWMLNICTHMEEFDNVYSVAVNYPNIFASVGVHPCNVQKEKIISLSKLLEISHKPKVIGFGETGLDYYWDNSEIHIQKISFLRHIEASQKTQLPLIIHSRNADKDMIEILCSEHKNYNFPAVIHCFTSSRELAYTALDLGMYISISGIVTFKNAEYLQKLVVDLPLEKLLIETDSPYLAPAPNRGKRNEPSNTYYVAQKISDIKNLPLEQIMQKTTNNFFYLFNKATK